MPSFSLDKIKSMLATANEQNWLYFLAGYYVGVHYRTQISQYILFLINPQ